MKRERQVLNDQIDFYVNQMGMLGTQEVSQKTDPLRNKLRDVRNRIEMVERLATSSRINVEEIVERVKKNCTKIMESLEGLGRLQLRHLLQGLIKKIVVDLDTRETTMEVHMPSWMVNSDSNVIERVCAENATAQTGVFGQAMGGQFQLLRIPVSHNELRTSSAWTAAEPLRTPTSSFPRESPHKTPKLTELTEPEGWKEIVMEKPIPRFCKVINVLDVVAGRADTPATGHPIVIITAEHAGEMSRHFSASEMPNCFPMV